MSSKFVLEPRRYSASVDYGRTPVEMADAGRYDWVINTFCEPDCFHDHVPTDRKDREALVLGLAYYMDYRLGDAIMAPMLDAGLRPATYAEIAAFGEANPDEPDMSPSGPEYIVGIGGFLWQALGASLCPCLFRGVPDNSPDRQLRSFGLLHQSFVFTRRNRLLVVVLPS